MNLRASQQHKDIFQQLKRIRDVSDDERSVADPVNVHIGQRIRARRFFLGKSQRDLATEVGVSQQQITRYEDGETAVSAARLMQLAEALETPIASFYPIEVPETPEASGQAQSLLDLFDQITDSNRDALINLALTLAAPSKSRQNDTI